MEELQQLRDELGNPSAAKLFAAARKKGLQVTKSDVSEILDRSTRELFAAPQKARGAHATIQDSGSWQADLAVLTQYSAENNKDYSYFLQVTNVFDREVKTEPLKTREAPEVWAAFVKILDKWGKKPSKLDVDDGTEWGAEFAEGARRRGIVLQVKEKEDRNGIAVNDASMKAVKEIMFRMMAKDETTSWINYLDRATAAYNKTPHGTTYGEAPEDVKKRDNKVVQFRLMQDNAAKLKRNANQLQERQENVRAAGSFRAMLPRSEWQRAFKPRYSGEVKTADTIDKGNVVSGGKRYALARVQPTGAASKNVPAALAKGSERRNEERRAAMREFVQPLKNFLRGGPKHAVAVGKFLSDKWGFDEKIKELRLGGSGNFVKLFPETFEYRNGKVALRSAA